MSIERFNYVCLNQECSLLGKSQVVKKNEEEEEEKEACINCGEDLKLVGLYPYGSFSAVSLMTKEEKKKMLLKRSHNHFKKKIEPYKNHLHREFFNEAKSEISKTK